MSFSSSSSYASDDSADVAFFLVEDYPTLPPTPLPTTDSDTDSDLLGERITRNLELLMISPYPEDPRRPETSTSSICSFAGIHTPPPSAALRLPTFIVPRNDGFYSSSPASDSYMSSSQRFHEWIEECKPRGGSFARENAEELAKKPRVTRSEPALPSLFKKREQGCGYCRSVGYSGWETHTRQRCRQLRRLAPCKICGANGVMNHTETYCPEKPSVVLPLSSTFIRASDSRLYRRRSHFLKYSSLIDIIYDDDSF